MKRLRLIVAAAIAAATMAVAPPAAAQNCVGAEGLAVVCADPTGRVIYSTCFYTGGSTCEPVVVVGPDVTRCEVGSPSSVTYLVVKMLCAPF